MALEVQRAHDVPEGAEAEQGRVEAADALVRAHDADRRVLEGRDCRGDEAGRRPEDVVVDEQCDRGAHTGQDVGDLAALVRLAGCRNVDVCVGMDQRERPDDAPGLREQLSANCDDVDGARVVREHRGETFGEIGIAGFDGRDYHCHVFLGDGATAGAGDWCGFVQAEEGYHVDEQAEVAEDEEADERGIGMVQDCKDEGRQCCVQSWPVQLVETDGRGAW